LFERRPVATAGRFARGARQSTPTRPASCRGGCPRRSVEVEVVAARRDLERLRDLSEREARDDLGVAHERIDARCIRAGVQRVDDGVLLDEADRSVRADAEEREGPVRVAAEEARGDDEELAAVGELRRGERVTRRILRDKS
jgi:hypothetical protein